MFSTVEEAINGTIRFAGALGIKPTSNEPRVDPCDKRESIPQSATRKPILDCDRPDVRLVRLVRAAGVGRPEELGNPAR